MMHLTRLLFSGENIVKTGELKGMIDRVFNPTHVAYHYASLFRHAMEDMAENGTINARESCTSEL